MAVMPKQKPGKSKQDYGTPFELLEAIRRRLNISEFDWDLAASFDNSVVAPFEALDKHGNNVYEKYHYDEDDDALVQDWTNLGHGWNWLNPPYANIEPWVAKARYEALKGANTVMLVPASVGANWWKAWVEPYTYVTFLNGRLTFVGETTPYPKDCALLFYTPWGFRGNEVWSWNA